MQFIEKQTPSQVKSYHSYLKAICSLSRLFSDSDVPYLYYRAAENVFCKAFQADNLSRDDLAYDAVKDNLGIGLKTFISSTGAKSEKIAEFNKFSSELRQLKNKQLVVKLAELRNERIDFANRTFGIKKGWYHCVSRKERLIQIYETPYDFIDINYIQNIHKSDASIFFEDNKNEYSFNFSKSTLFRKFYTPQNSLDIEIDIISDPFELILKLYKEEKLEKFSPLIAGKDFVILPLYSLRYSKPDYKVVSEKSGLNQWNAGGRKRDRGEVYIPIPIYIHKNFPNFFPPRNKSFSLRVPTDEVLNAKVCQENGKALMTNPNNALADWLLRKILKLKEGELLTYEKLNIIGIDSVRIIKIDTENYKINFAKIDSWDKFLSDDKEDE